MAAWLRGEPYRSSVNRGIGPLRWYPFQRARCALLPPALAPNSIPVSNFLADYFRSHVEEERDHVKWLRSDLESVGVTLGPPNPLSMAMVGTQYYMLKHLHPAALLGYMAVVEGDPVPVDVVNLLERLHGKDLLRFVRFHAVHDLEHRKELFEVINRAPESLIALVTESAENALGYFVQAAPTWG